LGCLKIGFNSHIVHRREAIRDLLNSANQGLAEMDHVFELMEQMKRGISDLEHLGGSPEKNMIAQAEERQDEILPFAEDASELVGRSVKLQEQSDDDLLQELTKMERFLSESRQIRESLQKKVAAIETDMQFLRQRRK
jgi:hypothetical protein